MRGKSTFRIFMVFLGVLVFVGLGDNATARDKEFIRIAGGATGATFHIIVSGISTLIRENVKWLDATPEPGGSVMNTRRVGTGK